MQVNHNIEKTCFTLKNRDGNLIFGLVSKPKIISRDKNFIIFCHPGPNNKTETGDFLRYLGDRLAEDGYYVLRFDQAGTGDSQGEIEKLSTMDELYYKVQTGMCVNDTEDIIDWVTQEFPEASIYLLGYCAGSHSALLASKVKLKNISGYIFIALPVIYSMVKNGLEEMRQFDTVVTRRKYVKKLLLSKSYIRLFTGKSDFGLIKNTVVTSIRNFLRNRVLPKFDKSDKPNHPRFNMGFWKAFQIVVKERKNILFLMAELDNETPDFNTEFKSKVLDKNPARYAQCKIKYLKKSDHALMFEEPRNEAVLTIKEWLNNA